MNDAGFGLLVALVLAGGCFGVLIVRAVFQLGRL